MRLTFEQVLWLISGPYKAGRRNDGHVAGGVSLLCRHIADIPAMMQVFEATDIRSPGAYTGKAHDFFAQDGKRVLETMAVPYVEQGQVQAYMIGMQAALLPYLSEEGVQVPDVIGLS